MGLLVLFSSQRDVPRSSLKFVQHQHFQAFLEVLPCKPSHFLFFFCLPQKCNPLLEFSELHLGYPNKNSLLMQVYLTLPIQTRRCQSTQWLLCISLQGSSPGWETPFRQSARPLFVYRVFLHGDKSRDTFDSCFGRLSYIPQKFMLMA